MSHSPWLTLGAEYVVLALYVTISNQPRVHVRLIPDEGGRMNALFDLADFEIAEPTPSKVWRVALNEDYLQFEPEAWMVPDFWSVFFGDLPVVHVAGDPGPIPDVTERFDDAVREMMDEAGHSWANEPSPHDKGISPWLPDGIAGR